MKNNLQIANINAFSVTATKRNTTYDSPDRKTEPHIHDFCEIYVNITGNVSFIVEKNIYTLKPGDIIVTAPYEYHHCVYHDKSDHIHLLLMFLPSDNSTLFDFLINKKSGLNNHIRLNESKSKKFINLCEEIASTDLTTFSYLANFFKIMTYIEEGINKYAINETTADIPDNLKNVLDYINKNFVSINTVNEIADNFYISISTLERYFKKYLSLTPKRYLEDKKLQKACMLLQEQYKVIDACFESGFTDYSHFIAIFKKKFKITPMKYKEKGSEI